MKPRLTALLLILPTTAHAQGPPCIAGMLVPHDPLLALYAKEWHETPVLTGISGPQSDIQMELITSPTGTWTIIATRATGGSCILAAGTDLMQSGPVPGRGM